MIKFNYYGTYLGVLSMDQPCLHKSYKECMNNPSIITYLFHKMIFIPLCLQISQVAVVKIFIE